MLLKTERNRRVNKREMEQLGLIDERTLKEKKTKNKEGKRKILIITLGLTIGMSLVFWTYREFRTLDANLIWEKMPKFNIGQKIEEKQVEQVLSEEINNIIVNDKNSWTIGVKNNEKEWRLNGKEIVWAKIETQLSKAKVDKDSFYGVKLPVGIDRKIIFGKDKNYYELLVEVKPPGKRILIIIRVEGNENDLIPTKNLFPEIVEKIYWAW